MLIQKELTEIQDRIHLASPMRRVELIAVTKAVSLEEIRCAYDLGLRDFGENKVQELLEKQAVLPQDIRWHMMGRLQTNKVKDIVGKTALVHSLDRIELYRKIDTEARKQKIRKVECLLQVNVSGEASKAGFAPEKIGDFLRQVEADSPVKIKGLMTMAPFTENPSDVRNVFQATNSLFESLKIGYSKFNWEHLSMGMSGDFEIAIEEGATMVRIGTALFGKRQ